MNFRLTSLGEAIKSIIADSYPYLPTQDDGLFMQLPRSKSSKLSTNSLSLY
jgi:hypothetical protein